MVDKDVVVEVLVSYRNRLKSSGQTLKAAAVDRCIAIVRKL
jgi:hypothetical protein